MSQDIFNQRIARITAQTGGARTAMAGGDGTATSKFSSAPPVSHRRTARRSFKPLVLGMLLGLIAGTVAAGLENPSMPWGPGFAYNDMIVIPTLLALCAGPVMAIAAAAMRGRFPSFFFFSVAYFPCVIGAALLDLPLF